MRAGDALDGFPKVTVQYQQGDSVAVLEVVEDVLRWGRNG